MFGFAEGFGNDTITDFTQGQDKIRIKGFQITSLADPDLVVTTGVTDTVITLTDATVVTITLTGFTATLTAGDFQFVA